MNGGVCAHEIIKTYNTGIICMYFWKVNSSVTIMLAGPRV